jgi:hypothetical protein
VFHSAAGWLGHTSVDEVAAWIVVDRLPIDWWRPANLHRIAGLELHFCVDDHGRTIELNGRVVAQGKRSFPYGRWDNEI